MMTQLSSDSIVAGFRAMVIAHIATELVSLPLTIISDVVLSVEPVAPPGVLQSIVLVGSLGLFLGLLVLSVLAWAGLLMWRSWGRTLFLISTIASHVGTLVLGLVMVSTSWDFVTALLGLSSSLAGAVCALAYVGPVATRFEVDEVIAATVVRDSTHSDEAIH